MRKRRKNNRSRSDLSQKPRKRAAKKLKKQPAKKTRGAGTLTESEFFSRIRSALRGAFRFWKPMLNVLEKASRPYIGPNKLQKKEYMCASCRLWFKRKEVEIDHIEECGSLKCYDDIVPFIKRLTREEESAFQVLCRKCHKEKTKIYSDRKKKLEGG